MDIIWMHSQRGLATKTGILGSNQMVHQVGFVW